MFRRIRRLPRCPQTTICRGRSNNLPPPPSFSTSSFPSGSNGSRRGRDDFRRPLQLSPQALPPSLAPGQLSPAGEEGLPEPLDLQSQPGRPPSPQLLREPRQLQAPREALLPAHPGVLLRADGLLGGESLDRGPLLPAEPDEVGAGGGGGAEPGRREAQLLPQPQVRLQLVRELGLGRAEAAEAELELRLEAARGLRRLLRAENTSK